MFQILLSGDCVESMRAMPEASIDAIVTDPPYGLAFMGKAFDTLGPGAAQQAWHEAWAREALRILKPGGYLLAFGGSRTYHRLACAVEDAGFEIRDCLAWMYGSGFPKSLDVSKAIDKAAGAERAVVGTRTSAYGDAGESETADGRNLWTKKATKLVPLTGGAESEDAKRWEGWGTALKPAHEPIVVARKPFSGTVAANVLKHGTGALNIDGCRVGTISDVSAVHATRRSDYPQSYVENGAGWGRTRGGYAGDEVHWEPKGGRWPANVIFTHAPGCGDECAPGCPVAALDAQSGVKQGKGIATVGGPPRTASAHIGQISGQARTEAVMDYGDTGGASRFFPVLDYGEDDGPPFLYCAKSARKEREAGCEGLPIRNLARSDGAQAAERAGSDEYTGGSQGIGLNHVAKVRNNHPTVKPVALMRWLVKLVTPPGGVVLDPFTGSGTTGIAAVKEGFSFIGCEKEPEYLAIAEARIRHHGGTPEVA